MSDIDAALWKPLSSPRRSPDALVALKAVPLFQDLRERELRKIASLVHARSYHSGEVVFRQGEAGAGMFIIRQGSVRIVSRGPTGQGQERELAVLTRHQFFGEMALLEDAPRSASSVAIEQTELLGFFQPDLEGLVERDAGLGARILWNLARLMAGRLRATNEAVQGVTAAPPG
jgi:CRP/FNR family cyclic AMP-dependent transcriptional regulator